METDPHRREPGDRSSLAPFYLAAMGRFHRYSLGNVLMIASQRPTATHIAGYHTWRNLGLWYAIIPSALSSDREVGTYLLSFSTP
ncbi:MAG TPA: hypothetical protein VFQ43_07585 [Nitrososphaera sp.]|nr:hypothetical protein [Nitrososphaera sp.]